MPTPSKLRAFFGLSVFLPGVAVASPWVKPDDNQIRADIALLAASGTIDDVTGQWPLSWSALVPSLRDRRGALGADLQPAVQRLLDQAHDDTADGFSGSATLDLASTPSLVYGFDGMGRGDGQAQLSLAYNGGGTSARLSLGTFTANFTGRSFKLMPDGSYIAQKLDDDVTVYGGWLSHWWGPGWISALAVSNNARPMPQIGIQRAGEASSWPVLNLLGPWQAEFFVGLLDDPRFDRNTGYDAVHVSFNPLPGLEIGLARTEEICGQHHPCVPLRDTIDLNNDPAHVNKTNDEGEIDVKWSHAVYTVPMEFYLSLMNEDSSPVSHSDTSHLFGVAAFVPVGDAPLRLTAEYTDSVPTTNIFSFGDVSHGVAYNNSSYIDGMRYRGRTLGFSLDSDSTLLSLQGAWSDEGGRTYELSFHHAAISNPANLSGNAVTTAPVHINMAEARVTLPWRDLKLDLAGRLQDDQLRPAHGFGASVEAALRVNF